MYSGLLTLCILAQAFAWLVAHFLQKFLSNAFCVFFPVTDSLTSLDATCKPLGLVPPETTLEIRKIKAIMAKYWYRIIYCDSKGA